MRYRFSYFQLRDFPSAIIPIAAFTLRWRVSSPLALAIQSAYSRLWLGGKDLNFALAFALRLKARFNSAGITSGFVNFGPDRAGAFAPSSLNFIRALM